MVVGDDVKAIAEELRALGEAKDASPRTIERLIEAMLGDASWWEDNPHYDGMTDAGWTEWLWPVAVSAIESIGGAAIDAVVARVRAGDAKTMERAKALGPPIVAEAMRILECGPETMMPAALQVLRSNAYLFGPVDTLVNFMLAYGRTGVRDDMLVDAWTKLVSPEGRAAILTRWNDGGLKTWIEERLCNEPMRMRHLAVLLLAVPFDEAKPLWRRVFAAKPASAPFRPLLEHDPECAKAVLALDAEVRRQMWELALRIARGGYAWESSRELPRPLDHGLIALFAGDAEIWERFITGVEDSARRGYEIWEPEWNAIVAYVHADRSRLDRAIAAAIESQLHAGGPGKPQGRHALGLLGRLDRPRMLAALEAVRDRIEASRNKWCFDKISEELGG